MKTIQESSRNIRKATGLGLLGLLLSLVPTDQADATVTVTDKNKTDGFVINSQIPGAANFITINETLSETTLTPITYLVSPVGAEPGIVTSGKTYFDVVMTFTQATNTPVTWTWNITNNTGVAWKDYHFEFWNSTFTTRLTKLTMLGSSSTELGNYTFLTEPVGYGSNPAQKGAVLSFYGATPGEVHENGVTGTYTMRGNLKLISGAASSGAFGLRQIATTNPEPSTVSLLGLGLAGLLRFRKTNNARML